MFVKQIEKDKNVLDEMISNREDLFYTKAVSDGMDLASWRTENSFLFAGGIGTQENPYQIKTEVQLRAFAVSLREDLDYKGIYIQLENDIMLGDADWIPIGEGEYAFRGFFDGQNYTISGLQIGMSTAPYIDLVGKDACVYFGLFGVLEADAEVRNLNLAVEIYVTSGQSLYVAGLAGYISQAFVENVHVSGVIEGHTTHDNANIFVGGITGYSYRQKIMHTSSSANVRAESVAGIAEAGGIVGIQNRGILSHCYASGRITGTTARVLKGGPSLGGIAGVHAGSMIHCCSTAAVIADCPVAYIGALVGWATGISDLVDSYYCFSSQLISGNVTNQRQEISPAVAVGWSVGRGVNGVGEIYSGSVSLNVQGLVEESMVEKILHNLFYESFMNTFS